MLHKQHHKRKPGRNRRGVELTERQRNVETIWRVPATELPDGPARLVLVALAYLGQDVYAYQSGGPCGRWQVWLGALADARPDRNGRVSAYVWTRDYAHLLAEFCNTPSPDGRMLTELYGPAVYGTTAPKPKPETAEGGAVA